VSVMPFADVLDSMIMQTMDFIFIRHATLRNTLMY
jgi:hypothetical protein